MNNKFGKYIGDLMLLVIEQNKDTTMYKLAVQEQKKLADDIYAFLKAQTEEKKETKKQFLKEKTNGQDYTRS